ncbi:MAG: lytic transglycosylase domain-containing protein [Alphaproteobacteria bacterium]|nr:lytic transglycosylase domain-containing protein [Alphaproteobacteria bacterium]
MHFQKASDLPGNPAYKRLFTKSVSVIAVVGAFMMTSFGAQANAPADSIGKLIESAKIPIPTPRPAAPPKTLMSFLPKMAADMPNVKARKGSLKTALAAVENNKILDALAFRAAMKNPVDKAILTWRLIRSGDPLIPYSMISEFRAQHPDFPMQTTMKRRAEEALARQKIGSSMVLSVYGDTDPVSIRGIIQKSEAFLAAGRKNEAARLIRDLWRTSRLSRSYENEIKSKFKSVLRKSDHKWRAEMLLYRERTSEAVRIAGLVSKDYLKLAKARQAVIRRSKAASALKKVPSSLRKDPSYIFGKVQHLRRTKNPRDSAALLQTAPTDPALLVDPDEWWIERKLASREMMELGRNQQAYDIAAAHRGGSPATIADAEFHAGWFALRFLDKPKLAKPHFENIARIATKPRSIARAYYWMGRADEAMGSRSSAKQNFQRAAQYPTVFYGQLANEKIGRRSLQLAGNPKISRDIRKRHEARIPVQAIDRLMKIGREDLAGTFARALSQTLKDPAEIVLLAQFAEKTKQHRLALQIGRLAEAEGHALHLLSFPVAAIPGKARVPRSVGKALVYSIARQESGFNPQAVSGAGARGLLQLMPATAKEVSRGLKLKYSKARLTSDPTYNATLGAAYLGQLLAEYNGSMIMTFAGYNAGGSRVRRWIKTYGDPRKMNVDGIVDWVESIPFTETRSYVQKIMENNQVYRARLNEGGLTMSTDLRRGS